MKKVIGKQWDENKIAILKITPKCSNDFDKFHERVSFQFERDNAGASYIAQKSLILSFVKKKTFNKYTNRKTPYIFK